MMKKILLVSGILLSITIQAQTPVLRLTLHSHNETNDPSFGVDYTNAQDWTDVKTKLNMLVDTLEFYQAKYNLQCESNFILANMNFDNAASSSTDFLETMENHVLIEVDPHNHLDLDNTMNPNYNPYNYADLAKLLDSTGISRIATVGGYIYLNTDWTYTTHENWTNWDAGIVGNTFPNYTWTPTVLWGGGTGNHVNDPFSLGIWRPAGPTPTTFINHTTTNLPAIGNGCEWVIQDVTDIDAMIADIQMHVDYFNGTLASDPDMFISGSVVFNMRYILTTGYVEKVCEFIRKINPLVQSGDIVWQNVHEKYLVWNTAHPNSTDNYILFCDDLTGLGEEELSAESEMEIFPNPSNGNVTVSLHQIGQLNVFNSLGEMVHSQALASGTQIVPLEQLPDGWYTIQVESQQQFHSEKLIIIR